MTEGSSRGSDAEVIEALTHGELEVTGRLVDASNGTFFATARHGGRTVGCVYKPVRGERPLWDFPDGTLAGRERAAYLVSQAGGWRLVPPTVLADGPFGPGMVQEWVEVDADDPQVAVVPAGEPPEGWFAVVDAFDGHDRPVTLLHRASTDLRAMALFDAVVNNADRKGGHLLPSGGRVLGCDHGLTFHVEDKLRTVLWGWADEPLTEDDVARLDRLAAELAGGELEGALGDLLSADEVEALEERVVRLRAARRMPDPGDRWPTIPWPPL